ncbi:MAG: hypothetical protein ABIK62_06970 [candidate division WOR-3 bacterium]
MNSHRVNHGQPEGKCPQTPNRSRISSALSAIKRVTLILLLAVIGIKLGALLMSRQSRRQAGTMSGVGRKNSDPRGSPSSFHHVEWPDWGGGQESRIVNRGGKNPTVIRNDQADDYALTLPLPAEQGQSRQFELPSTRHFREQLLPNAEDVKSPASDIPLYPAAKCRIQVGQGTSCFTGFYLTSDAIETVRSFYLRALGRLGWRRVTTGPHGPTETLVKPDGSRSLVLQLRRQDSTTTRIGLVALRDLGQRATADPAQSGILAADRPGPARTRTRPVQAAVENESQARERK